MENIIYACLCINPNFHYINLTLLINFLKTIHEYSSLKIPSCRSQYTIISARKKAPCARCVLTPRPQTSCPIFAAIILVSSVANALGVISM